MDWSKKERYLTRNPAAVARQIGYIFKQLWGKVVLSGMHPAGQILNFDDKREFQNRVTEALYALIHIADAPKIDENEESEVVRFIDKYITCALPDDRKYPELSNLVKKVKTRYHATTCGKKKGIACRSTP